MITDTLIQQLCVERAQLTRDLAHVLTRAGASHPQRKRVNSLRSTKRKALRKAIRQNAERMAGRCMQLMEMI